MSVKVMELPIPFDVFLALDEPEQQVKDEIRTFAAVKFYELGKLTIGKAAKFAGMSRFDFETFLSKHRIPISNLTIEDVEHDLKVLQQEQPGMVLEEGGEYPVWSPYGTGQAVKALHELLEHEKEKAMKR